MKKAKKKVFIFILVVSAFLFILGCDNAEKAATPSQQTVANFQAMFDSISGSNAMYWVDLEPSAIGEPFTESGSGYTVTFVGDQSSGTYTVVFTNYEDYYYDITINGTITMAYSFSGTSGSITINGTLTFTGTDATVSTIAFADVAVSVTGLDTSSPTVTVSGTITVDGVKYDASAFGLEDEF